VETGIGVGTRTKVGFGGHTGAGSREFNPVRPVSQMERRHATSGIIRSSSFYRFAESVADGLNLSSRIPIRWDPALIC
jgi:hypothetical protein